MRGEYLFEKGMRQVAEWASAYVENETTIAETHATDLTDEEKAALLLIHLMLNGGLK